MWYHGFGSHTRIEPGASPQLFLLFALAHALIHGAVFMAALSPWLQWPLFLLNALALRQHLLCWAFPAQALDIEYLELGPDGRFVLHAADGTRRDARLLKVVWAWPSLLVLRLRESPDGPNRWLVLSSDAVAGEALRRLRVRLRWQGIDRESGPLGRLFPARPVRR